jgi:hypothetical protein
MSQLPEFEFTHFVNEAERVAHERDVRAQYVQRQREEAKRLTLAIGPAMLKPYDRKPVTVGKNLELCYLLLDEYGTAKPSLVVLVAGFTAPEGGTLAYHQIPQASRPHGSYGLAIRYHVTVAFSDRENRMSVTANRVTGERYGDQSFPDEKTPHHWALADVGTQANGVAALLAAHLGTILKVTP